MESKAGKAYMSDASERRTREIDADQMMGVSATYYGDAADREARRILADTEPALAVLRTGYVTLDGLGEVWAHQPVDGNAHAALYEALAAFVTMEVE